MQPSISEPLYLKSAQQNDPLIAEAIWLKRNETKVAQHDTDLIVHENMLLYKSRDSLVWIPPTRLRNDIFHYIHNQG